MSSKSRSPAIDVQQTHTKRVDDMAKLLQRIADGGDKDAFRELFTSYSPRLRSFIMRQGADRHTAEEVAQETLMTVWRKAGLYSDEKGSATTWIYTIARNLRIDRLRREVPHDELPENRKDEASDDAAPDDMVAEYQRGVRIRAAMETLPDDQHEVIKLSFREGLSHSEIAERVGVPLGTVKSRMRLAYQKVREIVADLE